MGRHFPKTDGGWIRLPIRKHFCYPPRTFPQGVGPGAQWRCPYGPCRVAWQSYGVLLLHGDEDWPRGHNERAVLGPDRWRLLGWYEGTYLTDWPADELGEFPKGLDQIKLEHDLYDFRAMSSLYLKFLKGFANSQGWDGTSLYD